ncbi:MAG: hypothetical protein JST35_07530 [Armatimonadetes bacterium]|nr:hypothetical protein [Armatimonadota bacterium]
MVEIRRYQSRVNALVLLRFTLIGLAIGLWVACGLVLYEWFFAPGFSAAWGYAAIGVGLIAGLVVGFLRRASEADVALSMDRRMGLQDRITTARTLPLDETEFGPLIEQSAASALAGQTPKMAFPLRWTSTKTHAVVAGAVFVLTTLVVTYQPWLSNKDRTARAQMAPGAAKIEEIKKETLARKFSSPESVDQAKRVAEDLEKLQRQLEKQRLDPKEAEAKVLQLAQQLSDLEKSRVDSLEQRVEQMKSAGERLLDAKRQEMADQRPAGQDALRPDPGTQAKEQNRMDQLKREIAKTQDSLQNKNLSKEERKALESKMAALQKEAEKFDQLNDLRNESKELEKEMKGLEQKLDSLQKQMQNPNLSDQQKADLQKQMEMTKAQMEALKKQMEELKNAAQALQDLQKAMEELSKDENFKKMQQLMQEFAERAMKEQKAQNGEGDPPEPMTKEDIERLLEKVKELQEALKDDEKAKEILEELRQALENGDLEMGQGGMGLLGLPGMPGLMGMMQSMGMGNWGPSGPGGDDRMLVDTKKNNTSGKNEPPKGGTQTTMIKGKARKDGGPSQYIEIKAPTLLGARSSVPYNQVLPKYRQKADRAIERQQIPKRYQDRVREYFKSIQ